MDRQRAMWLSVAFVVVVQVLVVVIALSVSFDARGTWLPGLAQPEADRQEEESEEAPMDLQARFDDLVGGYLSEHAEFTGSVAIGDGRYELASNDELFETASIVKVEILLRWLLARQDDGLPGGEYRLAEQMMTASDNEATNELCLIIAGRTSPGDVPGGVDACTTDGLWGSDRTTAADQLRVLDEAMNSRRLKPESLQVVRDLMSSVVEWQSWGIGAAADDGETILLKNGWDDRAGWLVSSIGVIEGSEQIRLAVLTFGHTDFDTGVNHVEELSKLARQALRPE